MAEPDNFDPTHALDGWRPLEPAPLSLDLDLGALRQRDPLRQDDAEIRLVIAKPDAFDPTHVLDGWRAPAPASLDLELRSPRHTGRSAPDEAKRARLKARGYEMLDVEDIELTDRPPPRVVVVEALVEPVSPQIAETCEPVEAAPAPAVTKDIELADVPLPAAVEAPQALAAEEDTEPAEAPALDFQAAPPPAEIDPQHFIDNIQLPEVPRPPDNVETPVLDFHAPPRPAEPDPQQVIDDIRLPEVSPISAAVDVPMLDIAALTARVEADPRLIAHWQPLAWTALARRVSDASTEVSQTSAGVRVESRAPQWLCAVWPPQSEEAQPLGRWPDLAALVAAETAANALQQLLVELPPEARLWSAELETDWDLVAELVLHQDADLRPAQARALRELAAAERDARLARLKGGYVLQGRVARRRT